MELRYVLCILLVFRVESGTHVFNKCCYLLSADSEVVPLCSGSTPLGSNGWRGLQEYGAASDGLEAIGQRLKHRERWCQGARSALSPL